MPWFRSAKDLHGQTQQTDAGHLQTHGLQKHIRPGILRPKNLCDDDETSKEDISVSSRYGGLKNRRFWKSCSIRPFCIFSIETSVVTTGDPPAIKTPPSLMHLDALP